MLWLLMLAASISRGWVKRVHGGKKSHVKIRFDVDVRRPYRWRQLTTTYTTPKPYQAVDEASKNHRIVKAYMDSSYNSSKK